MKDNDYKTETRITPDNFEVEDMTAEGSSTEAIDSLFNNEPDDFNDIDIRDFEDDEGYDPDADYDPNEAIGGFIPSLLFSNPDPYFKREPLPEDHPSHHFRIDAEGHIWAKNPSAWWLPDITLEEEIGRTIYTVSGSYIGTETLDRKLKRILSCEAEESMRASVNDQTEKSEEDLEEDPGETLAADSMTDASEAPNVLAESRKGGDF